MLISIRHVTSYRYAEPVNYTIQSLRLTPASFKGQRVIDWSVRTPGSRATLQFEDGFGNVVHLLTINAPHEQLVIEAGGVVETKDCNGVVAGLQACDPAARVPEGDGAHPARRRHPRARAVRQGQPTCSAGCMRCRGWCAISSPTCRGRRTPHTGAAEALADGKGVCQDHAHIFIAAARTIGVPARYITGYLVVGEEGSADAHHAWAEAWVEGLGWVGFDVANRICPTERYVRLAAGLDAGYAAPITGSRKGGAEEKLDVAVEVQQQSAQQ